MAYEIIIKRAFRDISQNAITHLMTTLVVALTCLIFVCFCIFSFNLQRVAEHFGKELAIVVFLKKEVSQEKVPIIYQRIMGLNGVESVRFISSEEAFKKLENYFKDEREILEGVDPLFLPPSFEIQINKAFYNPIMIKEIAQKIAKWDEVNKVQYGKKWVEKLESFSKGMKIAVIASAILLLITAAFVVTNTIKLTVYSRQDEIEIMRLVGATDGFILGPFLLAAFIQGITGAGIAVIISYLGYNYVLNLFGNKGFLLSLDIRYLPIEYIGLIILISGIFCMLGTALSLRRFLRF